MLETQPHHKQEADPDNSSVASDLQKIVSRDLREKLQEYPDSRIGIKVLATLMGIHEKTLKRLIDCQNHPGYQTLFKIYRALFNTQNDQQVLNQVPPEIKEFLLKSNPIIMKEELDFPLDVEKELRKDPIFAEIYIMAASGGITPEYISYQYGKYGENLMQKMIDREVIAKAGKNKFFLGKNGANLSVESLHFLSIHLIENFFKPENTDEMGENFIGLYTATLTEEGLNEWLSIDAKAYQDKLKVARDPDKKGDIKAFTVSVIDNLNPKKSETRH